MKFGYLALAMFAVACAPAFALTNVSSCGTLTGDTAFKLTQNITTASGTQCLLIANLSGQALDLDCDGYSVGVSSSASYPLYSHDNDITLSVHNCVFNANPSAPFGTSTWSAVFVKDSAGTWNGSSGTYTWFYSNTFNGGLLLFSSVPHYFTYSNTFENSAIAAFYSDYGTIQYDQFDNSGYSHSSGDYQACAGTYYSSHVLIEYIYCVGYPGGFGTGNVDAGIILKCTFNPSTSTCTDAVVRYNTTSNTFNAGIELVGHWTYPSVYSNTFNYPYVAGLQCFGGWDCSIDNGYFDSNTVADAGNTSLMAFGAHASNSSYFTNNTLTNNSIDGGGNTNQVGYSGQPYSTFSGNTLSSNNFGSAGFLYIQQTSGISGSGNTCGTVSGGSSVTCP